jgi:threonylcarbamoyladenosine tRNA methylthiotransferase MtaB
MDCSADLVEAVIRSHRFVPHLHLPLQSGSDRVLARMRRPYAAASWASLIETVSRRAPHACLGTDLIAGFPGESADDFDATMDLVQQSGLGYLHVFPYSDRPGTDAAVMAGKVPPAEVRRRVEALRAVGKRLREAFERTQVGTVRDALTLQDPTVALTDNFLKVGIPAGCGRNERVSVRITRTAPLAGEIVSRPAARPAAGPATLPRPPR